MSQDSDEKRRWHIGKVIDAPMLVGLLLQTVGVVWYGAQLVKTVELQGKEIAEISVKVNQLILAQSGSAVSTQRLAYVEQELGALRIKAERLELEVARNGSHPDRRR